MPVSDRVYRPSRVGFVLLLAGFGVQLGKLPVLLLLPLFVAYLNHFQIRPEERSLLQQFGQPYAEYLRSARRGL